MDESLRHLLDTELQAERIAQAAEREREAVIDAALAEGRREQEQFEARIPELHASFIGKAEVRAEQTVNELSKRYDERYRRARETAEKREAQAVEAALRLLLDPQS